MTNKTIQRTKPPSNYALSHEDTKIRSIQSGFPSCLGAFLAKSLHALHSENKAKFIYFLLFLPLLTHSQTTFRLVYLGGQSNMNGFGYTKDLPADLNKTFDDVWIFQGNPAPDEAENGGLGLWTQLRPGHGAGFSSDGKTNKWSDRFGVELSLAQRLKELYPNDKIALVKYARGGTSIDSLAARNFGAWEPDYRSKNGINQYDHFLTTIRQAMTVDDIDGDGRDDELIPTAIVWMQGESDAALGEDIAYRYYDHLKRLMDLIRAALWTDDLPVVIGKISDSWNDDGDGKVWDQAEIVQYAQEKYARTDENAAIVRTTRYYKYSDPWHYDSDGYIDLGRRFAEAIAQLAGSQ